ncbi:hypothetical protein GOP47_0004306 [Adiantum capillus-veneris]|uniref:TOD1/MUCI70 glycosyltransferase-like domain-containing protein n=1 Tax=Adiantum capillus-veneris TaxID=13818 RepID=A0A9D4V8L4_ADICA|nr:hypothetical protein GOP47_0004306 [Adiantum capillus-veneris]
MNSLVLDLGHLPSTGLVQGRKQTKVSAKDRERSCLRLQRLIIGRRIGTFLAFFISAISLLMLFNITSRVTAPKSASDYDTPPDMIFNNQHQNLSMKDIQFSVSSSLHPEHETMGVRPTSLSSIPPPRESLPKFQKAGTPMQRIDSYQHGPWPWFSSDHPLPLGHPCQGFALPSPPADKKRTGPRPCPVCYLPIKRAVDAMPTFSAMESSPINQISYIEESSTFLQGKGRVSTNFGGHPSWEDRTKSYQVQGNMSIHCGFAQGVKPGAGSGFDIDAADQIEMDKCIGVVVASAIFGNYDQLQQPINVSKEARKSICFFMFVDAETQHHLDTHGGESGVWRVVVVRNLPYSDARRNGKIPKLLLHRLFPNSRFSLWIDGKLKLVVDPYQILERFLWRRNVTFAVSRHYKRFDVLEEAEANKAAGKYDNASINAQVDFYRSEGLVPYDRSKSVFPSDVPEGCVIIREHTPITNLFTCLWFNEVDRFTSRDQLSFAVVRDKLMGRVPFRLSMFLDCERRNFVVQEYHRDVLEQRKSTLRAPSILSNSQMSKRASDFRPTPSGTIPTRATSKKHKRASSRRKMGSRVTAKAE